MTFALTGFSLFVLITYPHPPALVFLWRSPVTSVYFHPKPKLRPMFAFTYSIMRKIGGIVFYCLRSQLPVETYDGHMPSCLHHHPQQYSH
ncbi:hypothetical protein LI328DRAFT_135763 [Trichoderma asperelloides]|nr:hypothetical protein LI328DRAFT_135763 [Trichoderma asperelloides]